MIIHTVKSGDTIYKLANQYGVSQEQIIFDNQIIDTQNLVIGQALVIPISYMNYTVKRGDTLYLIARKYGSSVAQILSANPSIENPSRIYIGQTLKIPTVNSALRTINANGYAFPSINAGVLNNTIDYLTYISIFSYQVRENGMLVTINDTNIINEAIKNSVKPIMTITNIGESGGFNSDLASTILNNENIQDALIGSIVFVLEDKNYSGLNIDFEYVYPSDREKYNNFVRRLVSTLKPMGYEISVAVAPKISANQQGTLYEAHDYATLGSVADYIIIMTYEWGYTYSAPQAVAPINQVERVLQYAVSVIPSKKILMGMPNYGYDWTLPYTKGTAARALTNLDAIRLAAQVGANVNFDTNVQAPYFYYYANDGKRHIVWFDDARSIASRLKLIEKYNLSGVSYWTINSYFRPNWVVLDSMYKINR